MYHNVTFRLHVIKFIWRFPSIHEHFLTAALLFTTCQRQLASDLAIAGAIPHAHAAFSREPAIRHRWGAREWDRGTQTWGGKRAKSVRVCPQQTRPSICWWHRSLTQTCPTSNPRRTPRCGSAPSPWVSAGMSAPRGSLEGRGRAEQQATSDLDVLNTS